jgi:hypothetical protein
MKDFEVEDAQLVGTAPRPGLAYTKTFNSGFRKELPVRRGGWGVG